MSWGKRASNQWTVKFDENVRIKVWVDGSDDLASNEQVAQIMTNYQAEVAKIKASEETPEQKVKALEKVRDDSLEACDKIEQDVVAQIAFEKVDALNTGSGVRVEADLPSGKGEGSVDWSEVLFVGTVEDELELDI